MVSDLVLEKELPEALKDSIEAYIGCLSGAILKSEYLKRIKEAGLGEIKIISEAHFPVEDMANDITVKAVVNKLKASPEKIKDVANSVVSIKVSAQKPLAAKGNK
jgi:L-fucose mutarotase/ribose pyranase (RbsD/FucU family)